MNYSEKQTYNKARQKGYGAAESLRIAKIKEKFEQLEYEGLVRLRAEPEEENYFSVYGEPDGYLGLNGRRVSAEQEKKELIESFERDGVWYVVSEWRSSEEDVWEFVDSIGMCAGYSNVLSPIENCYVFDLMRAAINKVEDYQSELSYEKTQEAFWREFSVEQDIFGEEI